MISLASSAKANLTAINLSFIIFEIVPVVYFTILIEAIIMFT